MNVPRFMQRGSAGVVCGLSLIGLSVVGVVAFAQDEKPAAEKRVEVTQAVPLRAPEPPDADDTDQDEPELKPEISNKIDKSERDALRKERDALMKQRAELDRKLAKISRSLGEPAISVFGDGRAFTFNTAPMSELRRKSVEDALRSTQDNKKSAEAYRRAAEEFRKSMTSQKLSKDATEEMKRAMDALKKSGGADSDVRAFYFNNDRLKALRNLPEMPAVPKLDLRFDDGAITLPKSAGRDKEYEAMMRRFEQKMEAWQKEFEAKMRAWEKKMDERGSKPEAL